MLSTLQRHLDSFQFPTETAANNGYPTTLYPITVPKNQNLIVDFKKENGDKVGYSLASKQYSHSDCIVFIQDFLNTKWARYPEPFIVPKEAVAVSFPHVSFIVGKSLQEFWPENLQKIPEDAYLSYKLLTKHVQVTYYHENGVQYLAGVTYYPQLKGSRYIITHVENRAIKVEQAKNGFFYPAKDESAQNVIRGSQLFGKFCKTKGARVALMPKDGGAGHNVIEYISCKSITEDCEECDKDFREIKAAAEK